MNQKCAYCRRGLNNSKSVSRCECVKDTEYQHRRNKK